MRDRSHLFHHLLLSLLRAYCLYVNQIWGLMLLRYAGGVIDFGCDTQLGGGGVGGEWLILT